MTSTHNIAIVKDPKTHLEQDTLLNNHYHKFHLYKSQIHSPTCN